MRWLAVLIGVCAGLWVEALAGGGLAGSAAALVVVAGVSLTAGLRNGLLPVVTAGVASAVLLSVADQVAEPGKFSLASDGVFYCVAVLVPALVGWLLASRNRQIAQLRSRRELVEGRRSVELLAARAGERERIVRSIDLRIANRLRRVASDADCAERFAASDPDRVPEYLESIEETARKALAELRDVLGTLRTTEPVSSMPVRPSNSVEPPPRPRRRFDLIDLALLAAVVPLTIETVRRGHHGPVAIDVIISLAQGGALMLLRRRELIGMIVLLALAIGQTAAVSSLPPTVSWLLPGLLAAFLLGLAPTRRTSLAGLAGLIVGVIAVSAATPPADRSASSLLPSLVMGVVTWIGGRLAAERGAREHELRSITEELQLTRQDEARLAALEQRAEIARDLHDAGAHALTVVCLQAGAARAWWVRDPARGRSALTSLVEVADNTAVQVGESLDGLAQDMAENGFEPSSATGIAVLGRALGLSVDVRIVGTPRRLPNDVQTVIFRVLQEAFTNAARHAPGSSVRFEINYQGDNLEVRVSDDGGQTDSSPALSIVGTGSGLRGMRERVETLRGELQAGPTAGGFEVLVRLPA